MPVLKRAHAVMFLEATREVSLASEAGLVGDHADWQVGASWIRKALARNLQPSPPDPVGDVLATFLEQLLEPAQRHAHGGGELRWIEGLVVEVRLDMGFGTLDDERAVDRLRHLPGDALGEAGDDEINPYPSHALGDFRPHPIRLIQHARQERAGQGRYRLVAFDGQAGEEPGRA